VYGSDANDFGAAELVGYSVDPGYDVQSSPFGWYFVTATDFGGNESAGAVVQNPTFAGELTVAPTVLTLGPPRPNPARGPTTIPFELPRRSRTTLVVYDVAGRVVRTLLDEETGPGRDARLWDGRGPVGQTVSPGVYFVRLTVGEETATRRFVRIR